MLADWYFCCCIKTPPLQAATYLSILDTLTDPSVDPEIIPVSVDELRRCDIWMRAYALPSVLALFGRTDAQHIDRSSLCAYFDELFQSMSEDIAQQFEDLKGAIVADSALTIETLERCISALDNNPSRRASDLPYLDLRDFLPETIILATLAAKLARDRGRYASMLAVGDDVETPSISRIVLRALAGGYGRMALLLAAEITGATANTDARANLTKKLIAGEHSAEPDMLRAYARLRFVPLGPSPAPVAHSLVGEIIDETVALTIFRGGPGRRPASKSGVLAESSESARAALPIVFWQITLYELAVFVQPETAAECLSRIWLPRWGRYSAIHLAGPVRAADHSAWKQQLERLLGLAWHSNRPPTLSVALSPKVDYSPAIAAVMSPWMVADSKGSYEHWRRYFAVSNRAALGRLLGAMLVAARLLRLLGTGPSSTTCAVSLLVHGADVLLGFGKWFRKHASSEADAITHSLPESWTTLAMFANAQAGLIGKGTLDAIQPDAFADLLNYRTSQESIRDQERVFRSASVPAVLTQWVMDGFSGIVDDDGPARWLPHLPQIYASMPPLSTSNARVSCAALIRFLRPDIPLDIQGLDWREATDRKTKAPMEWRLNHRQFFLVRDLPALDWLKPQWTAPDPRTHPAQLAVRAVERRSALQDATGLHPSLVAEWRREWLNELGDVGDLPDLDRLLRVRLLELLEEPTLAESEAEQTVITMLILDYGSHYDLQRLLLTLFPIEDEGSLKPAMTSARANVRRHFVEALLRYQTRAHSTSQDRTEPRTPREVIREKRRLDLVDAALWRLAAGSTKHEDHTHLVQLLDSLCQRRRLLSCVSRTVATGNIEVRDHTKGMCWDSPESAPQEWAIRAMVCDWTKLRFRMMVHGRNTDGVSNLFEWSRGAVQQFDGSVPSDRSYRVIGIVLDEFAVRDRHNYLLNVGLKDPVSGRMPRQFASNGNRIQPGEIVEAELRRMQGTKSHYWRLLPGLRVLPPSIATDVARLIHIRARGRSEFELVDATTGVLLKFDANEWDPDLSRAYSAERLPSEALATEKNGRWTPVEKSVLELLLAARNKRGRFFVATFVALQGSKAGKRSYLLSLGVGENYLIPASLFSPSDVAAIEEKLASYPDPTGLLISATPKVGEAGTRLALCRDVQPYDADAHRYPSLATPFDDRNLVWKQLDDMLHTPVAVRRGLTWSVDLGKVINPPFPQTLPVTLMPQPKRVESEVEFVPTIWDYRTPSLRGEPVTYHTLNEPAEGRTEFVSRWIELSKGDPVALRRAYPRVAADAVMCLTIEGVGVLAESESLTMRSYPTPVFNSEFFRYAQVVNHLEWKQIAPSVRMALSTLPEECAVFDMIDGVLASVPQSAVAGAAMVSVWWRTPEGVIESTIPPEAIGTLIDLASVKLHPGMRVVALQEESVWSIHFESRSVKVRALWRWVDIAQCGAGSPLIYLGEVQYHGRKLHVAEAFPGEIVAIPGPVTANHLSPQESGTFAGGIPRGATVTDLSKGPTWIENGVRWRVSRLRVAGGTVSGVTLAHSPERGEFHSARIVVNDLDGEYLILRRQLAFSAANLPAPSNQFNEDRRLRQELTAYLESPTNLDVVVRATSQVEVMRFRVPDRDGKGWTSSIPVAPNEGPYLAGVHYPVEGIARIFESGDGFQASFRHPPAATPEGYREAVLGASMDETVVLSQRLFYVGVEPSDKNVHRFEWGYGCTLLAHETELLFDGGPFSNARGVLFPGDSIMRLRFVQPQGDGTSCVIAIEQVNVELSETTVLYRQQSQSGVVHLLNLEYLDDEIRIVSVIGCAEASSDEYDVFESLRSAYLDYADQAVLLNARRAKGATATSNRDTILGRLDGEHFLNTFGKEVVFRHVCMAFTASGSIRGHLLEDGELIFMQAGAITGVTNDAVLALHHYPGMRTNDIGPEFDTCGVLRRRFSVRDDLLTQMLQRRGPNACDGTIYLVSVKRAQDRVHASILDGPPRRLRALAAAIDDTRAPLLATIVGVRESKLRVELQPGLFFSLPFDRFDYPEAAFERGTSVRIRRSEMTRTQRFELILAAKSDERYVPTGGRPAIALPKNVLLRQAPAAALASRARFWEGTPDARSRSFTIAGLPGIEAVPGTFSADSARWLPPDPRQFTALMQRKHPEREVFLGRDDRDFRIAPLSSPLYAAGALSINDLPVFNPMPSSENAARQILPWTAISFFDGSIAEIKRHSTSYSWAVHDTHSGSWKDDVVKWEPLARQTVETGPLFFDRSKGRLTLRFREADFTTFGFPVQELLDCLAMTPQHPRTFPVAGVSSTGGLWLELAPGRISELPAQLVTRDIRGREFSLSHAAWNVFAPGDQVVLQLASDRTSRIDRVLLLEWRAGARGMLGRGRSLLPIIGFDSSVGSLEVGGGEIRLHLPAQERIPGTTVALLPDNTVVGADGMNPCTGDTVLVGLEQDRPVVLGMPGVTPFPDRQKEAWATDPLSEEVRRQLPALVRAVGGALAVTVETFVLRDKVLYFSRRKQTTPSGIPAGAVSEASLLGNVQLAVLLRCGSEILKMQLSELLPGIPNALCERAVQALRASRQPVWVRRVDQRNLLCCGLASELSREFLVEPVCAISEEVQKSSAGVVCRSLGTLSLHWLPEDDIAWVRLAPTELATMIAAQGDRGFGVRRLYDDRPGPVSATRVLSVQKEFARFDPGTTFDARLLSRRSTRCEPNFARWLAVASGVGILLECEMPEIDEPEVGATVRLEVCHRVMGRLPTVTAVLLGCKRYYLDLPLWMTDLPPAQEPAHLQRCRSWCHEDIVETVLDDPAEDLDRKLIYVYRRLYDGPASAARANREYSIVRDWTLKNWSQPEMDPVLGVMAVLIFFRNGHINAQALAAETVGREQWARHLYEGRKEECRKEALRLLRHIGRRASHSAHVEVLATGWLCSRGPSRTDDLARRLDRLRPILARSVNRQDMWLIRQFCRAAELRSSPDLASIAVALRAAMGDEIDEETLLADAVVTAELIALASALPEAPGDCLSNIPDPFVERLQKILVYIQNSGVALTLLDYLPFLSSSSADPPEQSMTQRV